MTTARLLSAHAVLAILSPQTHTNIPLNRLCLPTVTMVTDAPIATKHRRNNSSSTAVDEWVARNPSFVSMNTAHASQPSAQLLRTIGCHRIVISDQWFWFVTINLSVQLTLFVSVFTKAARRVSSDRRSLCFTPDAFCFLSATLQREISKLPAGRSPRNFAKWSEIGVTLKSMSQNFGASFKKRCERNIWFDLIYLASCRLCGCVECIQQQDILLGRKRSIFSVDQC